MGGIQLVVRCPICRQMLTIESNGTVICSICGYHVDIHRYN